MDDAGFEQLKSQSTGRCSPSDLERLAAGGRGQGRARRWRGLIGEIIAEEKILLNIAERERLSADLLNEIFGLGPLEPLLRDPTISDFLVNGYDKALHRAGRGLLQKADLRFRDDATCYRSSTGSSGGWAGG
jgi:pilus assembly protein CpaF